jgi:hypothetical protein
LEITADRSPSIVEPHTAPDDEIGHITEADNAGVYEAPNSRDREQGASGGDVEPLEREAIRVCGATARSSAG